MTDEEYSKLFNPIADGIRDKSRRRQAQTRECKRVLDEKIAPAIEQAKNNVAVKGEWMEFSSNCIRIQTDEIQFTCSGDTVEIFTKIGRSESSDLVPTRDVSEELIAEKIARFFRRLYNLPTPED